MRLTRKLIDRLLEGEPALAVYREAISLGRDPVKLMRLAEPILTARLREAHMAARQAAQGQEYVA